MIRSESLLGRLVVKAEEPVPLPEGKTPGTIVGVFLGKQVRGYEIHEVVFCVILWPSGRLGQLPVDDLRVVE